jgi:peptidoglycan/LPS O-acetylase OafA/YrhL
MIKFERKSSKTIGALLAVLVFILVFAAMRLIADIEPNLGNIMVYIVFSILLGVIASVMVYFRLKIAAYFYAMGIIAGFIMMYINFLDKSSGWGDLIGVVSLLMAIVIGLAAGLFFQLIYYLYKRFRKAE